jgi:flavodoxin
MKATIVYYSKTGNTRKIAEVMAQALQVDALPLSLAKKGRRTKDELAAEKVARDRALSEAKEAELVILGTPTQFRKPHPSVVRAGLAACARARSGPRPANKAVQRTGASRFA